MLIPFNNFLLRSLIAGIIDDDHFSTDFHYLIPGNDGVVPGRKEIGKPGIGLDGNRDDAAAGRVDLKIGDPTQFASVNDVDDVFGLQVA